MSNLAHTATGRFILKTLVFVLPRGLFVSSVVRPLHVLLTID